MQSKKHRLVVFSGAGDTTVAEWEEKDVESTERARGVFEQACFRIRSVTGELPRLHLPRTGLPKCKGQL